MAWNRKGIKRGAAKSDLIWQFSARAEGWRRLIFKSGDNMGRTRWCVVALTGMLVLCGQALAQTSTVVLPEMLQMVVSPGSGMVAAMEDGKAGLAFYANLAP